MVTIKKIGLNSEFMNREVVKATLLGETFPELGVDILTNDKTGKWDFSHE
jgi:hypothetical protein